MVDTIIEKIKTQFLEGSIPDLSIIKEILEPVAAKLHEAIVAPGPLESDQKKVIISEAIRLLFEGDIEGARAISKKANITSSDFLELAKIAFDLAAMKHQPDSQFRLITNFIMDPRRISQGVLAYMGELIKKSQYDQAVKLKTEYKDSLRKTDAEQMGRLLFEQAMTFNPEDEHRNYHNASRIRELFEVNEKMVTQLANVQYEYNFIHKFYGEAIEVACIFGLPKVKTYTAVEKLFTEKFNEFKKALFDGRYHGNLRLTDQDPYRQAILLLGQYKVMDKNIAKDKDLDKIRDEIQNAAYGLILRLAAHEDTETVEPAIKLYFTGTVISDYKLLVMENEKAREECKQISGSIIDELKDKMDSLDAAVNGYTTLFELYSQMPSYRQSIQEIAYKMFELFLDNSRPTLVEQSMLDFNLNMDFVFPSLKKKALAFLEENKFDEYQEFTKRFSLAGRLRSDADFMQRAFFLYESRIFASEYSHALTFLKLFKFGSQQYIAPLKFELRNLLKKEKIEEAHKLISMFHIKNQSITDVLRDGYERELEKGSQSGYSFRQQFNISIGDVGFLRWLLREVLNLGNKSSEH